MFDIFKQFIKYGIVGAGALAVDVGSFVLLRNSGMELIYANTAARLIGAGFSYCGQYFWTFKQPVQAMHWFKKLGPYALLWLFATWLSSSLIMLFVSLNVPEGVSKLGAELVTPLVNFLVSRYWIFKSSRAPSP
jgi:putative flippase GtrA